MPKVEIDKPKEGKVFALFQNLENRGANLTYAWEGVIYTYEDGQVYQMSQEQIDHLNSLAVMEFVQEVTPDGQMVSKAIGKRHRFSVRPVGTAEMAKLKAEYEASKPA